MQIDRQTDRHHHCLNLPVVWGLKNKQNWHRLRGDTHFTVTVDNDDHTCSTLRSHHPDDLEKTQCQPIMDSPWSITWLWTERNSEVNGRQRVQWARSSVMRCQVSDLLQPPQLRLTPEAHHQPASADTAAIRSAILTTRSPFIRQNLDANNMTFRQPRFNKRAIVWSTTSLGISMDHRQVTWELTRLMNATMTDRRRRQFLHIFAERTKNQTYCNFWPISGQYPHSGQYPPITPNKELCSSPVDGRQENTCQQFRHLQSRLL